MERKFTCDNVKMTSNDFKGQSVWSAVEEFHWVPFSLEDVLVPLMPGRLHLSELLHLHIFILYSAIKVKAIDSHLFYFRENLKKRTCNYTYVHVQATIVAQLRVHRTKSLTSNSNGPKRKRRGGTRCLCFPLHLIFLSPCVHRRVLYSEGSCP